MCAKSSILVVSLGLVSVYLVETPPRSTLRNYVPKHPDRLTIIGNARTRARAESVILFVS